MRRTLIGSIAALALGSASSVVLAADMAPPPEPIASWTGFYLGAGGGAAWADLNLNQSLCEFDDDGVCFEDADLHRDFNDTSDAGIVGIVQGGFDTEVASHFVIGIGADATFGDVLGDLNRNSHDDVFDFDHHFNNDGSTMVDAYFRAGFIPIGTNFLIFGLVGWSWVDIDTEFRLRGLDGETVFHNSDSFNANGVTFGGGVEWKFTDNLSIRASIASPISTNLTTMVGLIARSAKEIALVLATRSISMSSACCSPLTGALATSEQLRQLPTECLRKRGTPRRCYQRRRGRCDVVPNCADTNGGSDSRATDCGLGGLCPTGR